VPPPLLSAYGRRQLRRRFNGRNARTSTSTPKQSETQLPAPSTGPAGARGRDEASRGARVRAATKNLRPAELISGASGSLGFCRHRAIEGNSTTDFMPGVAQALTECRSRCGSQRRDLNACWLALDAAAGSAEGKTLA
jgi:hypothetical protein